MKYPVIAPLIAAICNFLLTLFVLSRSRKSSLNRVYFLWGMSISVWNFGTYFMFKVSTAEEALYWAQFLNFGVIFIPVTLIHLSMLIARISVERWLHLLYIFHCILAVSNFTDFFVAGVRNVGYAWYSVAGPGFWIFGIPYSLTVASIFVLIRKRRELSALHKTRLTYLIIAQSTLVFFGTNDILPILGIDTYPFTHIQIYPYGSIAAFLYGIVVGFAVLQHQLLDIRVTLGRFAAQFVRLLFMFLVGVTLLLLISLFAPGEFTPFTFFATLGVLLVSATVASLLFPRFFGSGEEAVERWILGDRFEYHDRVKSLIHTMQSYPETQVLLEEMQELLVETVKIQSYQIILLDETSRTFSLYHAHPERPPIQLSEWHVESLLFRYFLTNRVDYLACKSSHALPGETELERGARRQVQIFDAEFCFPLFSGAELFGVLLLGTKTNGELFTPYDLQLLTEMVQSLSLVLNQIRLKNQVSLAQEQELLGRMSRGLAHDLNNLLTPVQTLLQVLSLDGAKRDAMEELLSVALRNVETIRVYVQEALFFSRTHSLNLKRRRLDETVRATATLMEAAAQQRGVVINTQDLVPAEMELDEVMMQRMLGNLLSNAIDASPTGAQIKIRLRRLPKTELARDWFRMEITDEGEGISAEDLKRIFTPYFTTKNRGDGKRGFGLGLLIARKIVHLHGGNLNIASVEKRGTTVRVDLPDRRADHQSRSLPRAELSYT